MSEEIQIYHGYECDAQQLMVSKDRANYIISLPGGAHTKLKRDVDFGMIRRPDGSAQTKMPTLFKSGAEKVAMTYGLCQHYTIESKAEDIEAGFFFYSVRCDLVKIVDGKEYTITSSYGSANTRERRNGRSSGFDTANNALKMAQKRALVSAALSLGCMSDAFTQDIESDVSDDAAVYFQSKDPNAPITARQITYFYAAAGRHGMTKGEAKAFLKEHGYASAKEIKAGGFDALIDAMDEFTAAEAVGTETKE